MLIVFQSQIDNNTFLTVYREATMLFSLSVLSRSSAKRSYFSKCFCCLSQSGFPIVLNYNRQTGWWEFELQIYADDLRSFVAFLISLSLHYKAYQTTTSPFTAYLLVLFSIFVSKIDAKDSIKTVEAIRKMPRMVFR